MGSLSTSRLALALVCIPIAAPLACAKTPKSGKYCAVREADECVYVDLDHDLVTFYDRQGPLDVAATYSAGFVDSEPKQGKYAGKRVRFSFDLDNPTRFTLAAESSGSGEPEPPVEFTRK